MCLVDIEVLYWGHGPHGHDVTRRPDFNICSATIIFCICIHTGVFCLCKTDLQVRRNRFYNIGSKWLPKSIRWIDNRKTVTSFATFFRTVLLLRELTSTKTNKSCFHTCTTYIGKTYKCVVIVLTVLTKKIKQRKKNNLEHSKAWFWSNVFSFWQPFSSCWLHWAPFSLPWAHFWRSWRSMFLFLKAPGVISHIVCTFDENLIKEIMFSLFFVF